MTVPTFQTRSDARRFLIGLAIMIVSLVLFVIGSVGWLTAHSPGRYINSSWFWIPEIALLLALIGQMIDSGPARRALIGKKTKFGLLSPAALRAAFHVARSGPKGKAPLAPDAPNLFAERWNARSFLIGIILMPVGVLLPLILNVVFAGTDVKHPTPGWIGLINLLTVAGLVLVVLQISRFLNQQDSLPEGQKAPTRSSWTLFFSGDGMRQAFRVALGR